MRTIDYSARMATQVQYPLLTAREFLEIDFGERKAELDNGVIRTMAGGTARHSGVQIDILTALRGRLRDTGCRRYTSDMAVQTHDSSIRYPDVAVYRGRNYAKDDEEKAFDDPRVIFEVLSTGTARSPREIARIQGASQRGHDRLRRCRDGAGARRSAHRGAWLERC